jgi:hypothetical protein
MFQQLGCLFWEECSRKYLAKPWACESDWLKYRFCVVGVPFSAALEDNS